MFRGLVPCACAVFLAVLALAPGALAGGPSMSVGAAEDAPKSTDAATSKAKLDLAVLSGFDTIRVTQQWTNGATSPGASELAALQNTANAAALDGVRLVVTTGGTGIAARDVTPEATLRVCEKVIPGFGELMRAASMQKTAMAPLSRAMAATRGTALIVNLPGSESGARENLQAILHLIPHALQLLEGKTEH